MSGFVVLPPQEGPPTKKPKSNHENNKKEKRSKSPSKEHKKSDNEVTVEVSDGFCPVALQDLLIIHTNSVSFYITLSNHGISI